MVPSLKMVFVRSPPFLDLTVELWSKIYEQLFGGFENLDSEEEMSEDELESIPAELKTKNGYLKDSINRKPRPGMFLKAQSQYNIDMGRSIMIGDHNTDEIAAKAAGVKIYVDAKENNWFKNAVNEINSLL